MRLAWRAGPGSGHRGSPATSALCQSAVSGEKNREGGGGEKGTESALKARGGRARLGVMRLAPGGLAEAMSLQACPHRGGHGYLHDGRRNQSQPGMGFPAKPVSQMQ